MRDFNWPALLIVVWLVIVAVFIIPSFVRERHQCSAQGGVMVRGYSWNGYVCVDKGRN